MHARHADVHQNHVGVLVFVHLYGFNTVVCSDKMVALLEHNLHQFVVTILVFGHQDGLHMDGRTLTDADGTNVGRRRRVIHLHTAYGTFEGQDEGEGAAFAQGRLDTNIAT